MLKKRLTIVLLASLAGCNSISSTMLNRTDSDFYVGNSNGYTKGDGQSRPFKGVPITVRVPTHLDVAVKESVMFAKDTQDKLYQLTSSKRHIFVEANLVETDKVFTVDPKRPAAGTLTQTLTFGNKGATSSDPDNSQYFKTIAYNIQDNTIKEVNNSLNTLLPLLGKKPTTAKETAGGGENLSIIQDEVVGVIAWKRFDLDAPDFEAQVECFIEQHLNQCDVCQHGEIR